MEALRPPISRWRLAGRQARIGAVAAMALSGCLTSDQGIDGWQRITFEGDTYRARGYSAEVPPELLTLIETTTETSAGDEVDYAEVYAIDSVDHASVVVSTFFWAEGVGEGHSAFDLYLRDGIATYPPEVCSFFDPAAMGVHGPLTPEECR